MQRMYLALGLAAVLSGCGTNADTVSGLGSTNHVVVIRKTQLTLLDGAPVQLVVGAVVTRKKETTNTGIYRQYEGSFSPNDVIPIDDALAHFTEIIERDAKDAAAYRARGLVHSHQRRLDEAVRDYSRAIECDPGFSGAYDSRANALLKMMEFDKALNDAKQSIALNAENPTAYTRCASIYSRRGEYAAAIAACSKALAYRSDYPAALMLRGLSYVNQGRFDAAIRDYDKLLTIAPMSPKAWNNRGHAYRRSGQQEKALSDLERALTIRPDYDLAIFNKASVLFDMGRLTEAEECLAPLLSSQPTSPFRKRHLANGFALASAMKVAANDGEEATRLALKGLALDSTSGMVHHAVARSYLTQGILDLALEHANQAINLDGGAGSYYRTRSEIYRKFGDNIRANQDLRSAEESLL